MLYLVTLHYTLDTGPGDVQITEHYKYVIQADNEGNAVRECVKVTNKFSRGIYLGSANVRPINNNSPTLVNSYTT